MENKPCVLLAKPGLDGHDKGVRLVATAMRDAGIKVEYLGLRQSIDDIINATLDKKADFIGLSILSGVHLDVAEKMLAAMDKAGIGDIPLMIGGIIPPEDEKKLLAMGVAKVFPVGSLFEDTNNWVMEQYEAKQLKLEN